MAYKGSNHKGGRPPGSKSAITLEKEAILRVFKQKAMHAADVLLTSQLKLALGQQFLYKIEKEKIVGPKGGVSYQAKRPELVTSQWEIEMYLQGLDAEGNPIEQTERDATYYFITTKEANNQAIDSILDRTFGKAIQNIAMTDPEGNSLFDDVTKEKSKKAIAGYVARRDIREGK